MTPYIQGKASARRWIEEYDLFGIDAEEPRNPYQHQPKSIENCQWNIGFNEETYKRFGDPDRDMQKLERQFGC